MANTAKIRQIGMVALHLCIVIPVSAADTDSAIHVYPQACELMQTKALSYFERQGWPLKINPECPHCFTGDTRALKDEQGKRIRPTRKNLQSLTTEDLSYLSHNLANDVVFTGFRAIAWMRIVREGTGCRILLRFNYRWWMTELIFGIPVDGDVGGGASSLRLENAYLQYIDGIP